MAAEALPVQQQAADSSSPRRLPHILFLPYPYQGHFSAMINLALKLSSSFQFSSTILTSHHFLFCLLRSANLTQASTFSEFVEPHVHVDSESNAAPISFHFRWTQLGYDLDSQIHFVGVPDGFPLHHDRTLTLHYVRSLYSNLESGVDDFIRKSNCSDGGCSPVITCIVSESFMPWTQDVANRFAIPRVFFWTQSVTVASADFTLASSKLGYVPCNVNLTRRGQLNSLMVDTLPGLPPIDPYDLPYNDGDGDFDLTMKPWLAKQLHVQFSRINEADWVLVNSFEELEGSIAQALKPYIPKMLLVGPLNVIHYLEGKKGGGNIGGSSATGAFRGSVCEDDRKCMAWLDTKPASSVLFISFGSVHSPARESIAVISRALQNVLRDKEKEVYCLWAWRCWEREMFPDEFWTESVVEKERVLVVKWAPQVEVLSHPAIGGFLSHMGWNSTLESLSMGVPTICCPAFYDQYTNSWCAVNQWKIGVEMHYHRDEAEKDGGRFKLVGCELENAIRRVMQVNDPHGHGEELRKRAASLKSAASRAWGVPEGSSWKDLETFARFLQESV